MRTEYFKEKEMVKKSFKLAFISFYYHFSGSYLKTSKLPDLRLFHHYTRRDWQTKSRDSQTPVTFECIILGETLLLNKWNARAKGNFLNKTIIVQKSDDFNNTKCYKEKAQGL